MALFVSRRERRLWSWTLAIVVAIFSTLGLAGALAEQLAETGLTTVGFAAAMLLVGITVVIQGLRTKPTGAEIGVALGVAVVYLMVLLRMALAERSHLIEYGVVASFIYEALKERKGGGGRVPVPAVLAVLATGVVGVLDETIQLLLPSRHFDAVDMVFNALAAVMAVLARVALARARRRRITIPPGARQVPPHGSGDDRHPG
ncbi:MAG: VanZ family protein [bacterium]|nr:VanZ family protein [bacterium]MDE0501592.1 VanZ family protein [bacterium]